MGIVADVQCGGWSTTILNSIGAIFMFGILNGQRRSRIPDDESVVLERLGFPPAYPPTTKERYEPSTAIQQYSTGRSTVLGLADDNKVWMWESLNGFQIKPMHVDLVENKVTRVVAGWDRNSMYVMNIGIVYWTSSQDSDVIRGGRQEALAVADMMLIDSVTVPETGYRRKKNERFMNDSIGSRIGEVTNHVVLEGYIVFTTDLNKLFFYRTTYPMPALETPEPVELTTFYTASTSKSFTIRDIQGSYRCFAIFTHDGCVLTASNDLLNAFWNAATSPPTEEPQPLPSPNPLHPPPARTITSLAFGDWHFLALHSDGTTTSYGQELKSCGALGLGDTPASKLRGVTPVPGSWGTQSLPEGEGRTIFFEPQMEIWLNDMVLKAPTLVYGENVRKAYADYFESQGARWEEGITKEGEMGAYFVLKIAAAGWSSAALVLFDEEKADLARKAHIVNSPSSSTHPPSPTLSAQSVDSRGFAYEAIDSPGEQLINAFHAVYTFAWRLGRWFLGLTGRDAARMAEGAKGKEGEDGEEDVRYTWSDDPFPKQVLTNLNLSGEDLREDQLERW